MASDYGNLDVTIKEFRFEICGQDYTLPIYLCLKVKNPLEIIDLFLNALRKWDVVFIYPDSEYQYSITLQK